jgi:anhydro-N-acetylmuramic acid kinase
MKIAGVMTGTSCDGLDVSCLQFTGKKWKAVWSHSAPYPAELRKRVLDSQLPGAALSLRHFGELHRDLGIWITRILEKTLTTNSADVIACHGQTVAHFPAAKKLGFTLQLGDPSRIAEATGLTVISNFRDGDMAAGGQGAPLAPRFHQLIAPKSSAIHNIGGISNLTYVGDCTIAFDTGPGNVWIDAAAQLVSQQPFDRDGKLAAHGQPAFNAVEQILRMEYFHRRPPKSTGRDDFPFQRLLDATADRDANLVSTATAIAVESIGRAYEQFILRKKLSLRAIYFSGGGARNAFLMAALRRRLSGIHVSTLDELSVDSRYVEAQAFAYFGYLALQGKALGGPWTGIPDWAPPAHIIPGRNWKNVQRLIRAAG